MKNAKFIFYILTFFIAFAPFLPVPYAQKFLHEFFSGIGSIIFIPFFLTLAAWSIAYFAWNYLRKSLTKKIVLEVIGIPFIFLALFFLSFPFLDNLRDETTIWLNDGSEVDNFVNPFLGMKMVDCRNVNRDYDAFFKHNGWGIEFERLEYAPRRKDVRIHNDGIQWVFKENWYESGSGSQYSYEWANCLTDERQ